MTPANAGFDSELYAFLKSDDARAAVRAAVTDRFSSEYGNAFTSWIVNDLVSNGVHNNAREHRTIAWLSTGTAADVAATAIVGIYGAPYDPAFGLTVCEALVAVAAKNAAWPRFLSPLGWTPP